MQRVEVQELLAWLHRRRRVHTHAGLAVVVLKRVCHSFSTTFRSIHHKGRGVETSDRSTDVFFDVDVGLQRRTKVFHTAHHIVLVHVIRMHVDFGESTHKLFHDLGCIIDSGLKNRLISQGNPTLKQDVHRLPGDLGNLVRIVEVSVQANVFVELATEFVDGGECIEPLVVGQNLHGHHSRALGRKTNAPDVWHIEQALADHLDVFCRQVECVAARDDNIFEFWA